MIYMGFYAADVLRGELAGPYSDEQARRYARVALIPGELLEHDLCHLEDTARALHVPVSELRQARARRVDQERWRKTGAELRLVRRPARGAAPARPRSSGV